MRFRVSQNFKALITRDSSTAKKFVAAATFLEVLKVFPKSEISESVSPTNDTNRPITEFFVQNEEKVRYAKWKAAEIAKGFREGRLPAPTTSPSESTSDIQSTSTSKRVSPPPSIPLDNDIPHTPQGMHLHASSLDHGETSPGSWSTVATPGTGMGASSPFGVPSPADQDSPLAGRSKLRQEITPVAGRARSHSRSGSGDSEKSIQDSHTTRPRRSSFAQKGNGNANAIALGLGSDAKKSVHFTPSTGGLTSTDDQSEAPSTPGTENFQFSYAPPPPQGTSRISPPIQSVASNTTPTVPLVPPTQYSPPQAGPPAGITSVYTAPTIQNGSSNSFTHLNARTSPPIVPSHSSPPSRTSPTQSEVILTPTIIAKAQKHCRFAISSLDYEDADQARKELRAALATLGG